MENPIGIIRRCIWRYHKLDQLSGLSVRWNPYVYLLYLLYYNDNYFTQVLKKSWILILVEVRTTVYLSRIWLASSIKFFLDRFEQTRRPIPEYFPHHPRVLYNINHTELSFVSLFCHHFQINQLVFLYHAKEIPAVSLDLGCCVISS